MSWIGIGILIGFGLMLAPILIIMVVRFPWLLLLLLPAASIAFT